ncbi:SDR family NAD(P)-dependent oxidoreductase [Tissierella carlieri]|jgi:NAD(P)-dependent dehydrogenase (short-subunit alcohol dehydrogenase family)|uniref:SDR family NAD(P)-dependent oxidoreductase n=1 Tax=Tissierella carlieri TaxID=689904 RepID=UPI0038659589
MKTLFLTGGNNGIGYYMVKEWLQNGNYAAVLDMSCGNINRLKEIYPESLLTFESDVCNKDSVKIAVNDTNAKFGSIDYAVHNACLCLFKSFEEHSKEDFSKVIDVNFYGAINLTEAVIPIMKSQRRGKICFTSSGVGITGFIDISSYASSKGAIEAFAKCMNIEYEDSGVTFHIMHPPLTDTESSSPLPIPKEFKSSPEKVGKGFVKNIDGKKFIITPSFGDKISVRLSYAFSLPMGRMLVKMTKKAKTDLK